MSFYRDRMILYTLKKIERKRKFYFVLKSDFRKNLFEELTSIG